MINPIYIFKKKVIQRLQAIFAGRSFPQYYAAM